MTRFESHFWYTLGSLCSGKVALSNER